MKIINKRSIIIFRNKEIVVLVASSDIARRMTHMWQQDEFL